MSLPWQVKLFSWAPACHSVHVGAFLCAYTTRHIALHRAAPCCTGLLYFAAFVDSVRAFSRSFLSYRQTAPHLFIYLRPLPALLNFFMKCLWSVQRRNVQKSRVLLYFVALFQRKMKKISHKPSPAVWEFISFQRLSVKPNIQTKQAPSTD